MEYLKVEGHSNLLRDPQTNSIVNKNKMGYNEYIAKRNKKLEENQKIQTLEQDVSTMKEDLNEIKSLLKEIINGSQRNNS